MHIRKLAIGYGDQVSGNMLRGLAKRGLVEQGPEGRLTAAGLELHRVNPPFRTGRIPKQP